MISFFVQLIKTLGRIAPEFPVPGGDDWQLPPRLASLVFSRSVSAFLMFISSNRQLAFVRRGE